ncbi:hypothetical protein [Rubritalea marina]|uniref:hypothetical protein n=1 Tax=Rubritalea marina TaxID=361055 RepID=UPI00036AEEF3|nr:hypothetical protein [Rubritalea marina]
MKTYLPVSLAILSLASCTQTVSHPYGSNSKYPQASWHGSSNSQVVSPYAPHNLIDVRGLKPGHHAYDPSTAGMVDGKPEMSKAKIFLMPRHAQQD